MYGGRMKLAAVVGYVLAAAACRTGAPARPSASAAAAPALVQFQLYKFGQRIGVEHARVARAADGSGTVRTTFTFNDRGIDVPLAAQWVLAPGGLPTSYQAWGFVARGTPLDDRVQLDGAGTAEIERQDGPVRRERVGVPYAIASGYAPVIGQELLIKTWVARRRPASLPLLPEGSVRIESRGHESFTLDGKPLKLEHLAIFGLVWGREDVWIDDKANLVALVTRDFEFDHFEAIRAGNEPLADELVRKAGEDSVAWLGEVARQGASAPGMLAFVGARLVDGTDAPPIADATVIVDGDNIVAVGPRASTPVPAGARTIDVRGATIVPGLWDMHAHVEQVEQASAYLAAGVTTVRDEGNIPAFITAVRDAIDAGRGVGPRVIVDCLVDSEGKKALGTLRVNTVDDIAPLVEHAVKIGCGAIKVYSSMIPALVAPLAAEAHRRGLRVTGHVPIGMNVKDVLDAGFDGVNHVQYVPMLALPKTKAELDKLTSAEKDRRLVEADLTSPMFQELFARMAKARTTYDPTLALFELLLHPADVLATREPGLAKVPRQLRGVFGFMVPPDEVAMSRRIFEKMLASVREMHARGVPIVAGTDIGVPGHTLHRELELYVQAGFTPLEALQAATIVPARLLGKDQELGTIAVGKRADLVVVDGDPLANISALRKVRLVVARGRTYDPATMWKLAGFQP